MTVLLLARDFDPTADAVLTELARRGVPVFRTDLAAFPQELRMDARLCGGRWSGRLWNAHHAVALEEIRSIWNR
ncbi:MAG TPA: ATP-grasp ribosomal peptide maturase, partial [Pseudonocardiaceae bacterium]|nr:ATP-grasp ribosomal peptide maturase [Pseudonocardiaceae bacterium]